MFDTKPDKYEDLLERVKQGPLTTPELDVMAKEIQKPQPDTDRYILLYLLGRGGNAAYKSIVEPYLEGPDDMLARMALWVLCWYWDLTSEYIDHVIRFMRGVYWDELAQGRLAAIDIAGDYLAKSRKRQLLWELMTICEDKGEDPTIRAHAYSALATALGLGLESQALPFHEEGFNVDAHIDPAVLAEVKERIATQGG